MTAQYRSRTSCPGKHTRQQRRRLIVSMLLCILSIVPSQVWAQSEQIEYYALDAIGSVRVVFDATGNVKGRMDYAPFGEELFSELFMPAERFAGMNRDLEAGLDYAQARMYQPQTGRFNSPDPLFGSLFDPQEWNVYSYASNDPAGMVDPEGLQDRQPNTRQERCLLACGNSGAGIISISIYEEVPAPAPMAQGVPVTTTTLRSIFGTGQQQGRVQRRSIGRRAQTGGPGNSSFGSGDPVIDILTVVEGFLDGLLLDFGDDLRALVWDIDPVNPCLGVYTVGNDLSMAVGASRLAYASSATALRSMAKASVRDGANATRVAMQAVEDRNTLKRMFRVGLFPNAGIRDPVHTTAVKGVTGAIQSSGKTDKYLNVWGAGAAVSAAGSCNGQ